MTRVLWSHDVSSPSLADPPPQDEPTVPLPRPNDRGPPTSAKVTYCIKILSSILIFCTLSPFLSFFTTKNISHSQKGNTPFSSKTWPITPFSPPSRTPWTWWSWRGSPWRGWTRDAWHVRILLLWAGLLALGWQRPSSARSSPTNSRPRKRGRRGGSVQRRTSKGPRCVYYNTI